MQGGQRSDPGAGECGSVLSSLLFSQAKSVVYQGKWGETEWGVAPQRFKLLSVKVTLRYLDSNYTCQLRLSPHLSPSLSVCVF